MCDREFIYTLKKASIFKYVEEIWGWDEAYQQQDFNLDFNPRDFKIIVLNDVDIGFFQINKFERMVNITELHLLESFRGKGIGSSVIKDIIKTALSEDKIIQIGCFKSNERAFKLYCSLGFRLTHSTETHFILHYQALSHPLL